MMDVLYVGSGMSARMLGDVNTDNLITCALNNAWRAFTKGEPPGYWIHSGDLPASHLAPPTMVSVRIGHHHLSSVGPEVCDRLGIETKFPHHEIGYTMFFQGLFWIITRLKPKTIYLLGMDHDYDQDRVAMWRAVGCPGPHNRFNGDNPQDVSAWAHEFFAGTSPDTFYGHGTPDPMRLGAKHLAELFERAKRYTDALGVTVLNVSGVTTGINSFPQCRIPS